MPPKEYEKGQLFIGISGGGRENIMSLSDCPEIVIDTSEVEGYEKLSISKSAEIEFSCDMNKKAVSSLIKVLGLYCLTNNWRKLHGLPMKRRKRK